MDGYTKRGFSKRAMRMGGVMMLLFPIWAPFVDDDGLRLPGTPDLRAYAVFFPAGVLLLWWGSRGQSKDSEDT